MKFNEAVSLSNPIEQATSRPPIAVAAEVVFRESNVRGMVRRASGAAAAGGG